MPASSASQLKGGRNHISVLYVSPQTDNANITLQDKAVSGTEWAAFDNTAHSLLINTIGKFSGTAGLTIEGMNIQGGYPQITPVSWNPDVRATSPSGLTISALTQWGRYVQFGKLVFFQMHSQFTLTGTPNTFLIFTPPVAPAATGISVLCAVAGSGRCSDNSTTAAVVFCNDPTFIYVSKSNGALWTPPGGSFTCILEAGGWLMAA